MKILFCHEPCTALEYFSFDGAVVNELPIQGQVSAWVQGFKLEGGDWERFDPWSWQVFGGLELQKNVWKLDAGHSFSNYHLRKVTKCFSFIVICRKMLQYFKVWKDQNENHNNTLLFYFWVFQDILKGTKVKY